MSDSENVSKLTQTLLRNARKVDLEIEKLDKYAFQTGMPIATGTLIALMSAMYVRLPEDDFLKGFVPQLLQEKIDELGEEAVMAKLRS